MRLRAHLVQHAAGSSLICLGWQIKRTPRGSQETASSAWAGRLHACPGGGQAGSTPLGHLKCHEADSH